MPDPVYIREETPEEAALRDWFDEQALAAPDNLEAAARLIITLVTTLIGLLLGVLAVAGEPLPGYFNYPSVRWLGVAAVGLLLIALAAALVVVFPFRQAVDRNRPSEQRDAFQRILERKSAALRIAAFCFGLGLLALGAVLVIALLIV
jgi:hypothetical protein